MESDHAVSCAALTFYLDYLRKRSVPEGDFLAGLRYPRKHLLRRFNFVDYQTLLELERRFEALFPAEPDIHFQFGRFFSSRGAGGWIGAVFKAVLSPSAAYRSIPGVVGLMFPFLSVAVTQRGRDELLLRYRYKDGFEPSARFMETVRGILTGTPVISGHPEALVTWRWTSAQEALFEVRLARRGGKALELFKERAARLMRVAKIQLANYGNAIEQLEETNRFLHQSVLRLSETKRELLDANSLLAAEMAERQRVERARRELEGKLHQAAKLEAIGRLASGVAHDMNNILGGIMGYASVLSAAPEGAVDSQMLLEKIIAGCRRGRELSDNLLDFARGERRPAVALSPEALFREALTLVGPTLDASINVEVVVAEDVSSVVADPVQLTQAIINLAINGADAMPEGGTLTLAARNEPCPRSRDNEQGGERSSFSTEGRCVVLEITDTGMGMDVDTVKRVHEPFFTTKLHGRGTGLGLSMTYSVVRNHNGRIEIDSTPGRGTTMRVVLPAGELSAAEAQRRLAPHARASAATYREVSRGDSPPLVLLVDDEPDVRDSGAQLLELLGCEVLTADNGAKAVESYRRNRDRLLAVLLDIRMPVLGGVEAFKRIRALDPHARVVIMSGHASDSTVEELLASGAVAFLPKPFDLAQMREQLTLCKDISQPRPGTRAPRR